MELILGPPQAAPCSPFGFEEAYSLREETFKEGKGIQGGKRHSRREEAFKELEEAFWEGNYKKVQRQTDRHKL